MKSTSRKGCLFDKDNKVHDFSGPLCSVTIVKNLRHMKKRHWFAFNAKDSGGRWFHQNLYLTLWCKKMYKNGGIDFQSSCLHYLSSVNWTTNQAIWKFYNIISWHQLGNDNLMKANWENKRMLFIKAGYVSVSFYYHTVALKANFKLSKVWSIVRLRNRCTLIVAYHTERHHKLQDYKRNGSKYHLPISVMHDQMKFNFTATHTDSKPPN